MRPQGFQPPRKGGTLSLWVAAGAVMLTAALGYYVKNVSPPYRGRFRGYRPAYRVQAHLLKTGVGPHPSDPSIPMAAWAEFEVKADSPIPIAAVSLQVRAKDLYGGRYATNGLWHGNRFIAYLRPGFKPPEQAITIIVSRGGSDLAMVSLPKPPPLKHFFRPVGAKPKTPGLKVSFFRTALATQPIGMNVTAPIGPHDLIAVAWGGSSYAPRPYDGYYTVVGPSQFLSMVDPATQKRSSGPVLVPIQFDYPEIARAVRLKVLVLRAESRKRHLSFTLPPVSIGNGMLQFSENAMREQENPFLLIVTRQQIPIDDRRTPVEFVLQNWRSGVEPLIESSKITLRSPATILGHRVALVNGTWVAKPPAESALNNAEGTLDPRDSSATAEVKMDLDQWVYKKFSEEEVVLSFDYEKTPTTDQRINPPSILQFQEPDQARMVTFSYNPFRAYMGSANSGSPRFR